MEFVNILCSSPGLTAKHLAVNRFAIDFGCNCGATTIVSRTNKFAQPYVCVHAMIRGWIFVDHWSIVGRESKLGRGRAWRDPVYLRKYVSTWLVHTWGTCTVTLARFLAIAAVPSTILISGYSRDALIIGTRVMCRN